MISAAVQDTERAHKAHAHATGRLALRMAEGEPLAAAMRVAPAARLLKGHPHFLRTGTGTGTRTGTGTVTSTGRLRGLRGLHGLGGVRVDAAAQVDALLQHALKEQRFHGGGGLRGPPASRLGIWPLAHAELADPLGINGGAAAVDRVVILLPIDESREEDERDALRWADLEVDQREARPAALADVV